MNRTTPLHLVTVALLCTLGCAVEADPDARLAGREAPLVSKDPGVAEAPGAVEGPGAVKDPNSTQLPPAWVGACTSKSIRYHVFMRDWDKFACHDIDVGTGMWRGADGATPGTCTFEWSGPGAPIFSVLESNARYDSISYRGESPTWGPLVIQDCSPPCKLQCTKLIWTLPMPGMGRSPCSACGVVSGGILHMTVPSFLTTDGYVIRTADDKLYQVVTNGQQVASIHLPEGADGPVRFDRPMLW